ncbi:MAG: GNAT family N-acetyltransferase, partial [Gemmatales bacterium]|nr:GNAT family N-acetyltransferase [Gemmatales bacterium]MDW8176757.1 GNAT family N-acetyltransferase [Gemmatales bacterium]
MSVVIFKRYRMERKLRWLPAVPELPPGYFWVPWDPLLASDHAEVHYRAFCREVDAQLFPSFADYFGCRALLENISSSPYFLPQATWLIACARENCASIQCSSFAAGQGTIQNVGVVPEHRGKGLGRALVLRALHSFHQLGLRRAILEVTADNTPAVELYRSVGFHAVQILY